MRTDHPTHPIAAPATDRHSRWPVVNDLDPELPPLGNLWGLDQPLTSRASPADGALTAYGARFTPTHAQSPRRRPAPLATLSAFAGLTSLPLLILGGIGGAFGVLAVVLGVAGIAQVNRHHHYRGIARAITGIVVGIGSAIVGIPIMLVVILVLSL